MHLVIYMTSMLLIYKESCDENQIPIDTIPTVARAWTSSNVTFCCCSGTLFQSVFLQALNIRHMVINIKIKINFKKIYVFYTCDHSTSVQHVLVFHICLILNLWTTLMLQ